MPLFLGNCGTILAKEMADNTEKDDPGLALARLWCERKGIGWSVRGRLGTGGTAPVFEIQSPEGLRALKIYDASFSTGEKGQIELQRINQQLALKGHDCSSLVQVYEGGTFEERLYLLMSRAPGRELEKRLEDIPRNKIRHIVDQVARAALFLHSKDLCHRDIKAANIFVSDDFNQVTLLDISVIRNIHDPVGAGSDRDGRLPVLATARYSPPEYLFRLVEPGPKLWHALNIYQLGGLLHDLIMREPLFQAEYLKSSENRYRFAWIIATAIPKVEADDVDQDLMFTARQSLDKDWERRSTLRLQDFLAESEVQQDRAFQFLGLSTSAPAGRGGDISHRLALIAGSCSTEVLANFSNALF
jgi:serine/threonine protein kinase